MWQNMGPMNILTSNFNCDQLMCKLRRGGFYSQSKSSVHDKLHELHSHFPPIAQRTPSKITSSC